MTLIRRALISVSNKEDLLSLAEALTAFGIEILSTGGTAELLRKEGIPVVSVSDYTGQPEILDGRVKTLHPKIHAGILARRKKADDLRELQRAEVDPIDLVVVNLYPFEETIKRAGVSLADAVDNIDIGGPTMVRAAAKNWEDVTVVVDPADYPAVAKELRESRGEISKETNFRLAQKAFALTARYEHAICNYLTSVGTSPSPPPYQGGGVGGRSDTALKFPQVLNLQGTKVQDLRYGENPHQKAAYYSDHSAPLARQLHGKELSFNNILDLDAAINLVQEFSNPACVIVKHTNPCGVSTSPSPPRELFIAARSSDPQSAFGGIIGFNREVDEETAREIAKDFYECIVAPAFQPEAMEILKQKKNVRLMELPPSPLAGVPPARGEGFYDIKRVAGGLLVQERDRSDEVVRQSQVVTKRQPTEEEWEALDFAWRVVKQAKSNAIVVVGEEGGIWRTLGIGAGQMSRIDSVRIAIQKMKRFTNSPSHRSTTLSSDAFFPFRDSVDEAAKAGITAIIQPGGSIKDQEVIEAANGHSLAMVFTGVRHFRH